MPLTSLLLPRSHLFPATASIAFGSNLVSSSTQLFISMKDAFEVTS